MPNSLRLPISFIKEDQMEFEEVLELIQDSPFNKQFYEVNAPLAFGVSSLFPYTGVGGGVCDSNGRDIAPERIFEAVPVFQRDNDKWSQKMQASFINNVISGFKTHISLFNIDTCKRGGGMVGCQILDGLQRITAIVDFMEGRFKVFGHTYLELKEMGVIRNMRGGMYGIRVYSFDNMNQAIDFYVSMNENITHSPEDIQKALKFKG